MPKKQATEQHEFGLNIGNVCTGQPQLWLGCTEKVAASLISQYSELYGNGRHKVLLIKRVPC